MDFINEAIRLMHMPARNQIILIDFPFHEGASSPLHYVPSKPSELSHSTHYRNHRLLIINPINRCWDVIIYRIFLTSY